MKLKVNAKLDPNFQPLSLVVREMREATKENGQDVIIADSEFNIEKTIIKGEIRYEA